jgi:hypothetical protein
MITYTTTSFVIISVTCGSIMGIQCELVVLSLNFFKVAITKDINDLASITIVIVNVVMEDTFNG